MGWLSNKELQSIAAESRFGIFPSRIESFGLSVVEAMAAGLPVIAARGGAVAENIEEGLTGRLVPVNDPDALTEAILSLLEDQQSAENRAKAAKGAARDKFSWEKTADRMLELYQSIT